MAGTVVILGIFAADLSFRAQRLPRMGETILGDGFRLGPGGKGSNQAVAAARSGAQVRFITRIGRDPFGEMALALWGSEGIDTRFVSVDDAPTGAAFIFVDRETGENAIIVESGAAGRLGATDLDGAVGALQGADVFMTQLEQPVDAAFRGLELARQHGLRTILNPAPAALLPDSIWALCDVVTPNEAEASALSGVPVQDLPSARAAADALLRRGTRTAVITLGANGVLVHEHGSSIHIPAFDAGRVIDTTGAGDAFAGALAAAIAAGGSTLDAARFGCVAAGLAVTRAGTAAAMPKAEDLRQVAERVSLEALRFFSSRS
ncbi:ribokinase [Salinarimonas soli]|uniref:Ribokinase n=1 Tax=Salinarimonas soli TaxID=1638099 RepID=A0A5B2VBX3_9HYPH|nr:ribokinase [Salinarimonas soli]KAA2235912.1 ribokinase [Salinarimonas soli]